MTTDKIIFAGFGGQGIVAAGKTLIHAAMLDGYSVSLLPSYGPEMRGGFANCHVIISEADIAAPIITRPDVVIAMSAPALDKFHDKLRPGGTLIVDSYLLDKQEFREDIAVLQLAATRMAIDAGNIKFANVVMLGALMKLLGRPGPESMAKAILDMLPEDKKQLYDKEMKALFLGADFLAGHYNTV